MSRNHNHFETLFEIRRLIARYRWRFVVPAFVITFSVLVAALFLPRKYEAQAILERRNDLVMSEIAGRGAPQSYQRIRSAMNEELAGLPAVEQAVKDLGVLPVLPPDADRQQLRALNMQQSDLISQFHRNLWLRYDISTPEQDRVQLNFVDTDPQRAKDVVNRLVENYIDSARAQVDQMLDQAITFFAEKADEQQAIIDELEEKRLQFELVNAEVLPDDASRLLELLAEAERHLLTSQQDKRTSEQRILAISKQLEDLSDSELASIVTRRNPELAEIEKNLDTFRDSLDQALVVDKKTENHPDVISLRLKIEQLKEQAGSVPTEVVAERVYRPDGKRRDLELALLSARADLDTANSTLTASQDRLSRLKARNSQLFPIRNQYRKITQQVEQAQSQLSFWQDNQRRVQMAIDAEVGNRGVALEFIKPATASQRPSSPDFIQVVFAAGVLGILAGIGAVLLSERSDQTFRSVDHAVNHLPVPVIGTVAEIVTRRSVAMRRIIRALLYPTVAITMSAAIMATTYLNYVNQNGPTDNNTSGPAMLFGATEQWLPFDIDILGSVANRDRSN